MPTWRRQRAYTSGRRISAIARASWAVSRATRPAPSYSRNPGVSEKMQGRPAQIAWVATALWNTSS